VRILILTLVFSPDGVSTAALLTELAIELRRRGHDITVITTTPHYNFDADARQRQPLERKWGGWLYRSEVAGIPVLHAKVRTKGKRVISRIFDYLRFHVVGTLAAVFQAGPYDVVLAPTPPLTIGLHAWLLARLRRARFVYNVQELYPDVALGLGFLRPGRLANSMEWIQRRTCRSADSVIVISEAFRGRLLEKGVPSGKLTVIPNFVDTDFVRPLPRRNGFAHRLGLEHGFVVLYSGNLGLTQDFETLMSAADEIADLEDVSFVIVGDGARRGWLARELGTRAHGNVRMLPYQPRSIIPDLYATSDVGLIPLKQCAGRDTFPSKVYTIMASGRPVIAAAEDDTELARLVRQAECGLVVPPRNATALAQAVRTLYQNRERTSQLGANGRAYVLAHYSKSEVSAQHDRLLRSIVDRVH
jgi:colanic acid biosynthesis glycosyl transferase WcaI